VVASSAVPGRTDSRGLGYVWQRHVVEGKPIHGLLLLGAVVFFGGAICITLLRWYLLVRAVGLPLRLRDAFRYGLVGIFFNTFLPGSVGGDIIKAAVLARGQSRRTVAVATVIMDRVIALWALIWFVAVLGLTFWAFGLLEGPAKKTATTIVTGASLTVVVTLSAWLLLGLLSDRRAEGLARSLQRLPKVGTSAAELWRAVWTYRRRQASVAGVMALSWVGHVGFVLAFYCSAHCLWSPELGPTPTLTQHFLLVPIGLVMQAIFPTPGGAGGGEWGFGALYVLFLAAEANGILGSLVQRTLSWAFGLIGYVVYLWTKPGLGSVKSAEAPAEEPAPALPHAARAVARPEPSAAS
jgi:uncharacterized membrane protein YbhN (UPF0104 family)